MGELSLGAEEASDEAMDRIALAIRAMTDLVTTRSIICLDFVDVASVLDEGGAVAVTGIGEAEGEGRAIRAAEVAIADLKAQLRALGLGGEK